MSRLASQRARSVSGFTLVEVLVAMTILAVGVSALVAASGASAFRAEYLREREFSRWIASNQLTRLQVMPSWPKAGTTNAEVEMIGSTWHVRTRTRNVSDPALRRVDIEVRRDKDADAYLYSVTGFLGDPDLRLIEPPVVGGAGALDQNGQPIPVDPNAAPGQTPEAGAAVPPPVPSGQEGAATPSQTPPTQAPPPVSQ